MTKDQIEALIDEKIAALKGELGGVASTQDDSGGGGHTDPDKPIKPLQPDD